MSTRIERIDPVILDLKRTVERLVKDMNLLQASTILVWKGAWNATDEFIPGDVVTNGGFVWMALTTTTNVTPVVGTDWEKLQ